MVHRRFPGRREKGRQWRQGRHGRGQGRQETSDFWSRLLVKGEDNAFLEKTACPACGELKAKILGRTGPTFLRECRTCELVYISPRLTEAVREEMYSRNPGTLDSPQNLMLRHLMAERLQNMHREMFPLDGVARNSADLLEVGCGWGHFLQLCRPHYRDVEGVELSREQAAHARERFDLNVSRTDILKQLWPRDYNIITAWEVIEHLAYPTLFLKWAFDHLRPGGQLVLSTPNFNSLFRRLLGPRWFYLIPSQHLSYFTPETLTHHLRQAGFTEVRVFTSGRSLLRERLNDHNRIDRRASPRDQWLETLRIRDRIEKDRMEVTLDRGSFLKKAWHSALWRMLNALLERGFGDQMRVYARRP